MKLLIFLYKIQRNIENMTKTEEFQRFFKKLLNKENITFQDFQDFDKIEKLIEEGANINEEITNDYVKGTPLYHSICKLKEELVYFLISKDVFPDVCSIRKCCILDLHLLEELLKRFNFNKFINYDYVYILSDAKILEVFLGFIKFENTISYNFSYIKNGNFYNAKYDFFAIEYVIISYITGRDGIGNIDNVNKNNKKEIISMLKKQGHIVSHQKINEFISTYCDYENNEKAKKCFLDRFYYIYKYWSDL